VEFPKLELEVEFPKLELEVEFCNAIYMCAEILQ
jgi:hypothetical protein